MLHGALNKTLPSKQNSGDLLHQLALRRFGCLRSGVDLGTTTSGRRYWFRHCTCGWSCACSRWRWCRLRPRWSLLFSLESELFQLLFLGLRNFLHLICGVFERSLDDVIGGEIPMLGSLLRTHVPVICAACKHASAFITHTDRSGFALLHNQTPLLVHRIFRVQSNARIVDVNCGFDERMQLLKCCAENLTENWIVII